MTTNETTTMHAPHDEATRLQAVVAPALAALQVAASAPDTKAEGMVYTRLYYEGAVVCSLNDNGAGTSTACSALARGSVVGQAKFEFASSPANGLAIHSGNA